MIVKLFAGAKKFFDGRSEITVQIESPCTIDELTQLLGIPDNHTFVAFRNDEPIQRTDTVCNHDIVTLVPFVGGG